jgi:hypothetical protein
MNKMIRSYLETLVWSETLTGEMEYLGETFNDGEPLDSFLYVEDLPKSIAEQAKEDCNDFVEYVRDELGYDPIEEFDPASVGSNFLLSRNGHGAGFFDSSWVVVATEFNKDLQKAAKTFGNVGLDVWMEDGKLKVDTHN